MTLPLGHKPPATLSKAAAAEWQKFYDEFDIKDVYGLRLLAVAMSAYDTLLIAEESIKKTGVTFFDAKNVLKVNPATMAARDARNGMLSALNRLRLDTLPPQKVGRKDRHGH